MRYFFSTNSGGIPINVYRFDLKSGIEQSWYKTRWSDTDTVSKFLVLGDGWLEEVDEKTAKEAFPQAFKDLSK
jgi:hypothetical protein